jgi:outer membrane protein assembly factor BamA
MSSRVRVRAITASRLLVAIVALGLVKLAGAQEATTLVIQDISCEGNFATSCDFIRRQIDIRPGMAVDEGRIQDARLRLGLLPNFTSVDVRLEKGSRRGLAVVVIQVTEPASLDKGFALGSAWRFGGLTETLAARVADRNLFGTGKWLSLDVIGSMPESGPTARESLVRLLYFDPHLFGSTRYALSAGATYVDAAYAYGNGDRYDIRLSALDLAIGRWFGDSSFVTLAYRSLPSSSVFDRYRGGSGGFTLITRTPRNALQVVYGLRTEDDVNFPTHGWSAQFFFGRDVTGGLLFAAGEVRGTWTIGTDSFLTMQLRKEPTTQLRASYLDEPNVSLTYSHSLSIMHDSTRRARWYIGPALASYGFSASGSRLYEAGVRAGVRVETKSFGIVSFYAAVDAPRFARRD